MDTDNDQSQWVNNVDKGRKRSLSQLIIDENSSNLSTRWINQEMNYPSSMPQKNVFQFIGFIPQASSTKNNQNQQMMKSQIDDYSNLSTSLINNKDFSNTLKQSKQTQRNESIRSPLQQITNSQNTSHTIYSKKMILQYPQTNRRFNSCQRGNYKQSKQSYIEEASLPNVSQKQQHYINNQNIIAQISPLKNSSQLIYNNQIQQSNLNSPFQSNKMPLPSVNNNFYSKETNGKIDDGNHTKRSKKSEGEITKKKDVRAIQFLSAYGDNSIGEVIITKENLKQYLEKLNDPQGYDGRVMIKHFQEYFKMWEARVSKMLKGYHANIFEKEITPSTPFPKILHDCIKQKTDLDEVIESGKKVHEKYAYNTSLAKMIGQLQKRRNQFQELTDWLSMITQFNNSLDDIMLQNGIQSNNISQNINLIRNSIFQINQDQFKLEQNRMNSDQKIQDISLGIFLEKVDPFLSSLQNEYLLTSKIFEEFYNLQFRFSDQQIEKLPNKNIEKQQNQSFESQQGISQKEKIFYLQINQDIVNLRNKYEQIQQNCSLLSVRIRDRIIQNLSQLEYYQKVISQKTQLFSFNILVQLIETAQKDFHLNLSLVTWNNIYKQFLRQFEMMCQLGFNNNDNNISDSIEKRIAQIRIQLETLQNSFKQFTGWFSQHQQTNNTYLSKGEILLGNQNCEDELIKAQFSLNQFANAHNILMQQLEQIKRRVDLSTKNTFNEMTKTEFPTYSSQQNTFQNLSSQFNGSSLMNSSLVNVNMQESNLTPKIIDQYYSIASNKQNPLEKQDVILHNKNERQKNSSLSHQSKNKPMKKKKIIIRGLDSKLNSPKSYMNQSLLPVKSNQQQTHTETHGQFNNSSNNKNNITNLNTQIELSIDLESPLGYDNNQRNINNVNIKTNNYANMNNNLINYNNKMNNFIDTSNENNEISSNIGLSTTRQRVFSQTFTSRTDHQTTLSLNRNKDRESLNQSNNIYLLNSDVEERSREATQQNTIINGNSQEIIGNNQQPQSLHANKFKKKETIMIPSAMRPIRIQKSYFQRLISESAQILQKQTGIDNKGEYSDIQSLHQIPPSHPLSLSSQIVNILKSDIYQFLMENNSLQDLIKLNPLNIYIKNIQKQSNNINNNGNNLMMVDSVFIKDNMTPMIQLIKSCIQQVEKAEDLDIQMLLEKYDQRYGFLFPHLFCLVVEQTLSITKLIAIEEIFSKSINKMIDGLNFPNMEYLEVIIREQLKKLEQVITILSQCLPPNHSIVVIHDRYLHLLSKLSAQNALFYSNNSILPNFDDLSQLVSTIQDYLYLPKISSNQSIHNINNINLNSSNNNTNINNTEIYNIYQNTLNIFNSVFSQFKQLQSNLIDAKSRMILYDRIEKIIECCRSSQNKNYEGGHLDKRKIITKQEEQRRMFSLLKRIGEYLISKNENVILFKDQTHHIVFICKHNQRDYSNPIDKFTYHHSSINMNSTYDNNNIPNTPAQQNQKNYSEVYKSIFLSSKYFDSITSNPSLLKSQLQNIIYNNSQYEKEGVQVLQGLKSTLFIEIAQNLRFFEYEKEYSCSGKIILIDKFSETKICELNITPNITKLELNQSTKVTPCKIQVVCNQDIVNLDILNNSSNQKNTDLKQESENKSNKIQEIKRNLKMNEDNQYILFEQDISLKQFLDTYVNITNQLVFGNRGYSNEEMVSVTPINYNIDISQNPEHHNISNLSPPFLNYSESPSSPMNNKESQDSVYQSNLKVIEEENYSSISFNNIDAIKEKELFFQKQQNQKKQLQNHSSQNIQTPQNLIISQDSQQKQDISQNKQIISKENLLQDQELILQQKIQSKQHEEQILQNQVDKLDQEVSNQTHNKQQQQKNKQNQLQEKFDLQEQQQDKLQEDKLQERSLSGEKEPDVQGQKTFSFAPILQNGKEESYTQFRYLLETKQAQLKESQLIENSQLMSKLLDKNIKKSIEIEEINVFQNPNKQNFIKTDEDKRTKYDKNQLKIKSQTFDIDMLEPQKPQLSISYDSDEEENYKVKQKISVNNISQPNPSQRKNKQILSSISSNEEQQQMNQNQTEIKEINKQLENNQVDKECLIVSIESNSNTQPNPSFDSHTIKNQNCQVLINQIKYPSQIQSQNNNDDLNNQNNQIQNNLNCSNKNQNNHQNQSNINLSEDTLNNSIKQSATQNTQIDKIKDKNSQIKKLEKENNLIPVTNNQFNNNPKKDTLLNKKRCSSVISHQQDSVEINSLYNSITNSEHISSSNKNYQNNKNIQQNILSSQQSNLNPDNNLNNSQQSISQNNKNIKYQQKNMINPKKYNQDNYDNDELDFDDRTEIKSFKGILQELKVAKINIDK